MNREVVLAAAAVPGTLFVLANIGGSTASMTGGDAKSIRMSLVAAGGALVLASAATGSLPALFTTLMAIGVVMFATRSFWETPKFSDVTETIVG